MKTIILFLKKEIEQCELCLEHLNAEYSTNDTNVVKNMISKWNSKLYSFKKLLNEAESYDR
jgi:hypothetical protein